jgi:hypothetical protein
MVTTCTIIESSNYKFPIESSNNKNVNNSIEISNNNNTNSFIEEITMKTHIT